MRALRVRYQFGQSLRSASSHEGAKALADASHTLRVAGVRLDVSAVRKIRQVAAAIRPEEFEELLMMRTAAGLPLKWSHFELLARVRSKSRRAETARRILNSDMRVRCAAAGLARTPQS